MVLNMAQTWHQLRPGEVRTDCGGCHAHSQKPTLFQDTAAAKPGYQVFDLTERTPLLTMKDRDESKRRWDARDETGLRYEKGVKDVEYTHDVKPILKRSCVACHTKKADKPAGKLVLDDDGYVDVQQPAGLGFPIHVPGTYARLAADAVGKWGIRPLNRHGWTEQAASRYVRMFQSRRSLLIWKVFGKRLDGWDNEDFPYETTPGDLTSLRYHGKPAADTPHNRELSQVGYTGGVMPPPEAVAGTYVGPRGKKVKVAPLTPEDRLTLVRWIDLGCPIDLSRDGGGWALDEQRPTLALTHPRPGANASLTRLLVGMADRGTGLDMASFEVVADFALDGVAAGRNLASRFRGKSPGVWELALAKPLRTLARGKLTVSVKDRQGNLTRIERTFAVVPPH
jgi:hypothetical protein